MPNNTLQPLSSAPAAATPATNTYTDVNALAALKKDPNSPEAIKAVAQQVDALFLQMMLKSMRDANAEVGEPESNEMGMYQDMFDKQISLQLSQHQGLGLGTQLTRQLAAQAAAHAKGDSDAHPPGAATRLPSGASPANAQGATISAPAGENSPKVNPDTSSTAVPASSPSEFVSLVYPSIQRAAAALGVSPLGLLAQAALETGWGQRMARTVGGKPSLNMFGIKADDAWNGARAGADTVEFSGGIASQRHVAFRAYDSIEASVKDFAGLLGNSPRYRDAVSGGANAHAYVAAIARSGYATDPDYGNKLNEILNSNTFHSAVKAGITSL
jgi:peptidoglycan hydrolase FlgJ